MGLPRWLRCLLMQEDVGDLGSIPGLGRSPGRQNGNPLQYSCQENPMDRGAWWATVHGVAKSQTWLSYWARMQEPKPGLRTPDYHKLSQCRQITLWAQLHCECKTPTYDSKQLWGDHVNNFKRESPHHLFSPHKPLAPCALVSPAFQGSVVSLSLRAPSTVGVSCNSSKITQTWCLCRKEGRKLYSSKSTRNP